MRISVTSLLIAGLLIATPAVAQSRPAGSTSSQVVLSQLAQRRARVDQIMARTPTGMAQRATLARQRGELDRLIEKLQAGQQVDASEVDRLLHAQPR